MSVFTAEFFLISTVFLYFYLKDHSVICDNFTFSSDVTVSLLDRREALFYLLLFILSVIDYLSCPSHFC